MQDAVAAAGPLLVILGFVVFPLVWSVPEALVTAELATAFPENSGYVAWVTAAFGPFWGFQEGWWSWLSGVADNSIYPVMLADNLRLFVPALSGGWPRAAFVVALALTYMSYRGLHVVGSAAVASAALVVAPFVLLCVFAAPRVDPRNWLIVDFANVDWAAFLNVMFWNLNYWDSVSCLAGEVDRPAKTFPRALLAAVALVAASYLLPTMAALGVAPQPGDWQLGFFGRVAQTVAGDWLAWWVVVAAAASQIGQFQAEMASDAYQLQGMAERGFLPKALARRSRHGTPTVGILLSSLGVCCLSTFNFVQLVELLNAVYCLAELLEFAAFIALRVTAPGLPRPYRVPLPVWGLCAMLLPAALLLATVLLLPVVTGAWATAAATGAALVSGFALYPFLSWLREARVVEFADLAFDFAHTFTVRPASSAARSATPATPSPTPPGSRGGAAGGAGAAGAGARAGAASPATAAAAAAARRGTYTIVASGALHYGEGDDPYGADVFVDVAADADGRNRVTAPAEGAHAPRRQRRRRRQRQQERDGAAAAAGGAVTDSFDSAATDSEQQQ